MSQKPEDKSIDKVNDDDNTPDTAATPLDQMPGSSTQSLSVDEYDLDLDDSGYSSAAISGSSGLAQEATDLSIDNQTVDEMGIDQSSVGAWMASARAQHHMSVAEVANRLKLSREQIALLEANEFDQLAAPVFVRGYLNSYAKLLGLPAEAVLEQYRAEAQPESYAQRKDTSSSSTSVPSRQQTRFRFDRLILLGMILLLGYYAYRYLPWEQWFGNDNLTNSADQPLLQDSPVDDNNAVSGGMDSVTQPANNDTERGENPSQDVASPSTSIDTVLTASEGVLTENDERSADITSTNESVAAAIEGSTHSNNPVISVNDGNTLIIDSPRSVSETTAAEILQPMDGALENTTEFATGNTELYTADGQSVPSLKPSIDTETLTRAVSQRTFKLTFNEDCWVEALNSEGEKLLIGTIKRGATRTFESSKTVSFVLGKPNAVTIAIDGTVIEKDTYIKPGSGVSRFEL